MRYTSIFTCLMVCFGLTSSMNGAIKPSKNDKNPTISKKKMEIRAFFEQRLKGEDLTFQRKKNINYSEIKKYQDLVWKEWKEANARFNEAQLPPLNELSTESVGQWMLPSNLEENALLHFYWGKKGALPAGGYPMYLYLHGSGDRTAEWATGLRLSKEFNDAPSAYFIPQIPNTGDKYRWWQKSKQFAWEKLLRLALLSNEINPNRIYMFGISEGGYGSQRLASFYADYLAAAGPMAGGEPLRNAPPENCANIGFSLRTGAIDNGFYRNRLTHATQLAFDKLQKEHPGYYPHFIELIEGKGHFIDYSVTTPWLKQFTRNPYPKYINWENFEMDGWYRKGFYNLQVNERSNSDESSRTHYEMNITKNTIHLSINEVIYEIIEKDPQLWGIEMNFIKKKTPVKKGKITIYLNEHLVDLNQRVKVIINGKQIYDGKVACNLQNMVNSCALFYDPYRMYPAAIEVNLSEVL